MKWFQHFYKAHGEKLFGYLLRKSGNRSLADEMVQEAFTRYLEKYKDKKDNPALLFSIARNLFYDHTRQPTSYPVEDDKLPNQKMVDLEQAFVAREEAKRLMECYQALDNEDQEILRMVVSENRKYQEIAEKLKCSVANVKIKVHRARKRLRVMMQEKHNE